MFRFSDDRNKVVIDAGSFSARGGAVTVKCADWVFTFAGATPVRGGPLTVKFTLDSDNAFCIDVENNSDIDKDVVEVDISFAASSFDSPLMAREHRQLIQSQTLSAAVGVKAVHLPTEWCDVNPESSMVTVFSNTGTAEALLIGVLPPFGGGYAWVSARHEQPHMEGAFGFRVRFDVRKRLKPGQSLSLSPVVAISGSTGEALLEQYGRLIGKQIYRRFFNSSSRGVTCSFSRSSPVLILGTFR